MNFGGILHVLLGKGLIFSIVFFTKMDSNAIKQKRKEHQNFNLLNPNAPCALTGNEIIQNRLRISLNFTDNLPITTEISLIQIIHEILIALANPQFHQVMVKVKLKPVAIVVFLLN